MADSASDSCSSNPLKSVRNPHKTRSVRKKEKVDDESELSVGSEVLLNRLDTIIKGQAAIANDISMIKSTLENFKLRLQNIEVGMNICDARDLGPRKPIE